MVHPREQRLDLIIQGAGLAASLAGGGVLAGLTISWADGIALAAALTYGLTLTAMFVCSILNTTVRHPRWGALCRLIDHSFIYLLIAGTYTPFCLFAIGGRRGIELLIGIWAAALIGIVIRVAFRRRLKSAIITLYVLMGWSGLIHLDTILHRLTASAVVLLAAGGILYTAAAPVHRWVRLRYHSAIWHGCVLAAAGCHYAAVCLMLSQLHGQPLA